MFRLRSVLSALLVISMSIVTPFVATESATAAGTVSKTVIVKDSSGNLLQGAIVAFGYTDSNALGWSFTSPVTTDVNGSVTITGLPQDANLYAELNIDPAVSDTTNAAYYGQINDALNWNLGTTSTIHVQLQAANFRVNPKSSSGGDVPLYSSISYPPYMSGAWFNGNLLRLGPIGLYMEAGSPGWGGPFQIRPWDSFAASADSPFFALMRSTNSGPILLDPTTNLPLTSSGAIWNINLVKTTFSYQLVSPTDPTAVQPFKRLLVNFPDSNGNDRYFQFNLGGKMGLPDGTFHMQVWPAYGTSTYANENYTAVVTNGGTSVVIYPGESASGTPLTPIAGVYSLALALPNFSGTVLATNGSALVLSGNQYLNGQVLKLNSNNNYQYAYNFATTGGYALKFTQPGSYKIRIQPYNMPGYTDTDSLPIVVTGTAPNVSISYGGASASSAVVQNLTLASPNLILNVINPKTSTPVTNGWVQINQVNGNNESWVTNLNLDPATPGVASTSLADGTYRLFVNPQPGITALAGLTQKIYTAVISGSGASVALYEGRTITGTPLVGSSKTYTVYVANANVTGGLVDGSGNPIVPGVNTWINSCLQQLMPDGVNWNYLSCNTTDATGHFAFSVTTTGSFRVLLEPGGRTDFAPTYSSIFTVADANALASLNQAFGNIPANPVTVRLHVRVPGQSSDLSFANIQVLKDNQHVTWLNTSNNGTASLYLATPGTYRFVAQPPQGLSGVTLKSYDVTATGTSPNISIAIAGVTANGDGSFTLPLGTATLQGTVMVPGATTVAGNSQIVAIDHATNREMWEYSTVSDSITGAWSMYLPAGTYGIRANTPWGTSTYSNSDVLESITVDAGGNATLAGAAGSFTASTVGLHLNNPYWSGTIINPVTSAPLAQAHACLNLTISGKQTWSCANSDTSGNWVMSKPVGFVAFDDNSDLQVAENQNPIFAMADYRGSTAIQSAGLLAAGASGITLHPNNPNVSIKVLAGGVPASNLWLNLSSATTGIWYGGSATDSLGIAHFSASDLAHAFRVQIDTNNNPTVSATYAATTKIYLDSEMAGLTSGGQFSDTITLSAPNVKGTVVDPATSQPVQYSWIDMLDTTLNQWVGGANTNANGVFLLNAPAPVSGSKHYQLYANPPWNSSSTSTRHAYSFDLSSSNVVSNFKDESSGGAIIETSTGYSLTLSVPSVTGVVKDPTGTSAITNSWVVPTNAAGTIEYGQQGGNTQLSGRFGLSLADGAYQIYANTPWGNSVYSASAKCAITIAGGQVTTGGSCVQPDKSIVLPLRAPNYIVHVYAPDGTTPVQNVHVGIGVGMWNANAQTDASGTAALFIDPASILSTNNGALTGPQNMWLWIDPPWGTSDYVRTQCYSLQASTPCSTLPQVTPGAGAFAPASATLNVSLAAPNTHVTVKGPAGEAINSGAWVTLFSVFPGGGRNWLGGSNTDVNGVAAFNLDSAAISGKLAVQVDAPWNLKATYSGKTYDNTGAGLDYVSVNNATFNLTTPNLILNVKDSTGLSGIQSGWVGIENVNISDTSTIGWYNGYGLDQLGTTSISLPSSSRFKLTVYPSPGVAGVSTSCYLTTDGAGTVNALAGNCSAGSAVVSKLLTITLPIGNTSGLVVETGTAIPVVGAIVYANIVTGGVRSTDPLTAVVTSTNLNGRYSMQLDPSLTWQITVTPVNTPSDIRKLAAKTLSAFPFTGPTVVQDATLDVLP